jgi:hypothetical protein
VISIVFVFLGHPAYKFPLDHFHQQDPSTTYSIECDGNKIFILTPVADTLGNIGGGGGSCQRHGKILKFKCLKWHLRYSENTFCKKLGFQNIVLLMVRFVINHKLSIENQHFRENIYMIIYICQWNCKVV